MAVFLVCIPCHIVDNHRSQYCSQCGRQLQDMELKVTTLQEAWKDGWRYHHRYKRRFDYDTGRAI